VNTIHPRARFVALLAIAGAVATAATGAATASAADTSPFQSFHSRPDLHPPKITIAKRASGTAPGYIFSAPRPAPDGPQQGPLILDSSGHVVWFHPVKKGLTSVDFQAQRYKGKPVLTWSERPVINGVQIFEGAADQQFDVIFDSRYKEIRRVQATGPGVHTQIHEFLLTKNNNAIVVGYRFLKRDARAEGGSSNQTVIDAVVQVVSLKTNRVVFNWHSIDHVPLSSAVLKADPKLAYDYFHLNSVSVTSDHNLLISARHTSAVYKVSLKTGKVIWTLGGKHSDFKIGPKAEFWYQHDVVDRGKGVYTMFDNHLSDFDQTHGKQSRGLVLQLRLKKHGASTASLKRQYLVPGRASGSQGNFEQLSNGNVFIGWGISPFASEFSPAGKLLYDFSMPSSNLQSYRTFRYRFRGSPDTQPALVASREDGEVTAFASWNGTTTTRSWALMAGSRKGHLGKVASGPKRNFEVKLKAKTDAPLVRVLALDAKGKVIGTSPIVRPKKG
jgi:hypothetical protein